MLRTVEDVRLLLQDGATGLDVRGAEELGTDGWRLGCFRRWGTDAEGECIVHDCVARDK